MLIEYLLNNKYFKLEYKNGYFNLGAEYIDKCNRDNCMELLTIQVFVMLLAKPFPRFLLTVIWPYVFKDRFYIYYFTLSFHFFS